MMTIIKKPNKSRDNGPRTSPRIIAAVSMLYITVALYQMLDIEKEL
jgi:hypothetical protein